ncbi:MAG TPA: CBS domain-containing protein [Stellaceae bacterium]|nr:CBS domain-containing protein [Stellaceae bacterium]
MIAADIMTQTVVTVTPATTVQAIAKLLIDRDIGAVPVVDAAGAVVGIVTETDLLRRKELGTERQRRPFARFFTSDLVLERDYIRSHAGTASDVMRRDVVTANSAAPLTAIVDLMEKHGIKRVPIVDDGRLVGIVSRTDFVRTLASLPPASDGATHSDTEIRRRLVKELSHLPWNRHHGNNVLVRGGVVHFWGMVNTPTEFDALRVAAESVPGVVGVDNHTVLAEAVLVPGA